MTFKTLDDVSDLSGKTALVRVDFNVPTEAGVITDDTRLRVALPTIKALTAKGAKVALLAHFDRPKGKRVPDMSLGFVAPALSALLGAPVAFVDDCIGFEAKSAIAALAPSGVIRR
jgi:phosphoglycerate kinase